MSDVLNETVRKLEARAEVHESVMVAYSGGKDSLVILDLCCRVFTRVVGVHCYFVPGLRVVEDQLALARTRWGVEVIELPDPVFLQCLKSGQYCNDHHSLGTLPKLRYNDLFRIAASEAGIDLVVTGKKKCDGMNNVGTLKTDEKGAIFNPILNWRHMDILHYLAAHQIPLPATDGRKSSSFDLTVPNLLWLWDEHRDDFERIERWFPYVRAVVYRREWYGIGAKKEKKGPAQAGCLSNTSKVLGRENSSVTSQELRV
jgi:phosphoadenosine phosphosulfate reductase